MLLNILDTLLVLLGCYGVYHIYKALVKKDEAQRRKS